jgi:RimJ/RimL family protein N-acetyltransferase
MLIRKIKTTDAANFLELCQRLDNESKFMMLEPGERQTTIEEQTKWIKNTLKDDISLILVCEIEGRIVGYLYAIRESFNRMRHSAYIVTGILKEFRGQGIGSQLFNELDNWSISNHIHRLELTVMCHNQAGIALYKKMGFKIEGTKKDSLIVDGEYVDEYYMAKII